MTARATARLFLGGAALLTLFAGTSCNRAGKNAPGKLYRCDCTFLTDTDDESIQKVEICETTDERAQSAAIGCAQSGAPATITSCRCEVETTPSAQTCRAGDCAVREHR